MHAAANARKALEAGVTTVRDLAGSRPEMAVKHAMDDFLLSGACVIASGFVGMTAGHGDVFCPVNIERRLWRTADGVGFIKPCTSGGVFSVGDKELDCSEIASGLNDNRRQFFKIVDAACKGEVKRVGAWLSGNASTKKVTSRQLMPSRSSSMPSGVSKSPGHTM